MQLESPLVDRWKDLAPRKPPGAWLPRQPAPEDTALAEAAPMDVAPSAALIEEATGAAAPIAAARRADAARARTRFLSADGQTPTRLEQEVAMGTNDLLDVNFLDRCSLVRQAVGRITAESDKGRIRATGFLVAPGLVLTNHHVLPDDKVAGTGSIEFGYRYDVAGEMGATTRFELDPGRFFVADEDLDFAVVAVRQESTSGRALIADFGYLRLHPEPGKVRETDFVTIIQHPDGQPMQIALRENQVTRFQDADPFVQYEADTAHGSSGAPVFNDSLQIAALHSGGRIQRTADGEYVLRGGGSTPSLKGLSETDVVWEANAGVRVSFICRLLLEKARQEYSDTVPVLQQAMAGGDVLSRAVVAARTGTGPPAPPAAPPAPPSPQSPENESMSESSITTQPRESTGTLSGDGRGITIPLTLRVTLEDPRAASVRAGAPAGAAESALEAEASYMKIPVIYDGLETRGGYDPAFLELKDGATLPIPPLTEEGKKVAAPLLEGGGYELRYHKFSVLMHKDRRMAILTASNVDYHDEVRLINGKKPGRNQLNGFDKDYPEEWVTDARLSPRHQLPDVFFSEDRKAFDKGHLVRRDDVCWGRNFEDMQMSNGDTFHVTNCSPQIKGLNQHGEGEFNWGDLEIEIQAQTRAEKAVVFAGPVLDARDRWFRGLDEKGAVRVQVPSRYWKIVVAKGDDGRPQAFGFVIEQDVTGITEKEVAFGKEWKHRMVPISTITGYLRGWVDISALEKMDQHT